MLTVAYLTIAALALFALVQAVRLWRSHPSGMTLLLMIPLAWLWFDNLMTALGKWIGNESVLTFLAGMRYFWHWATLPLLLIVAGALVRRAGFRWAQPKAVMAVFCLVATFLILNDARHILSVDFFPACYGDTFRYVIRVNPLQYCDPANPPGTGFVPASFASPLVAITMLLIGLGLWWKFRFPWLAVAAGLQIGASAMVGATYYGPVMSNFMEPFFNLGIIAAAGMVARQPGPVHAG